MPDADPSNPPKILFEFTAIGRNVKVVAIDVASGTEVSIVGPASAARSDLERLARQKLLARMTGGTRPRNSP
jgi:Domain of unknown function (DUF6898)